MSNYKELLYRMFGRKSDSLDDNAEMEDENDADLDIPIVPMDAGPYARGVLHLWEVDDTCATAAVRPASAILDPAPVPSDPCGTASAAFVTDTGLVRDDNEDSVLCDPERGLFIVADGVGGAAAGDLASREAVRAVGDHCTRERITLALELGDEAVGELMQEALCTADHAILSLIEDNPAWQGMATTIVVGLRGVDVVYIANLGDSRAYRVRDGAMRLFSTDHSVAAALVAQGALSEEDARGHFLRNQVTGVLGGAKGEDPAYEVMAVRSGDRLLFCSDGLWDYVESPEIARIVTEQDDARHAVRALLSAAYAAGAPDNVAIIVVHVE